MDLIKWCNSNAGFLTAVLSLIGLVLSTIAIIVSLRTARLPSKKKILLRSCALFGAPPGETPHVLGMSVSATNIGNRAVSLTYLGYAIEKDGQFNIFYPLSRDFNFDFKISISEMAESKFSKDELLVGFAKETHNAVLYVYAKDTENKEYKCKAGTVGKLISTLSK